MRERWMYRIKLQFKKGTSTHTEVYRFFGENEKEINWHVEVVIENWTNGGWTLTERSVATKRRIN